MTQPLKDRFYLQIITALEGYLDPQVFERCMGDLLRGDFPGLVPVPGGADSGFDGAIADGQGESFPLVCTTEEDVIGNLTRSLDRVLEGGWQTRRVALATSQALTTQRRENLFRRAREKGFELMQPFDQSAIADRLYGNSRWRKELLGISGRPAALSIVPPTRRPLLDLEPVGREADLLWLRTQDGDRVLAGEPGSGKSFLLRYAMRNAWPALFLASSDFNEEAIADAYRDLKPEVIVVDDAHADPELLEKLTRLRRRMDAEFGILATTWKGARDEVMAALGQISVSQVRTLELLTRDEIVEVLRRVGVPVDENPELTRLLVNQAANKPGLAVTIASLALQGWWREILDGTALSRTLVTFFEKYLGRESTQVLAALSLGGDRGMSLEAVRDYLGLNRSQILQIAKGLAAGGVLSEVDEGEAVAVWPREMRGPLLRSVFFPDDGPRLDYRDLLGKVPSLEKTVEMLVTAKHRGASIPADEIRKLVERARSRSAWENLAGLSKEDALWSLESYPGDMLDIVTAALGQVPQIAICKILERAAELPLSRERQLDHVMEPLKKWVGGILPDPRDEVQRRWAVALEGKRFLAEGKTVIGAHAVFLALSPIRRSSHLDPGIGRTVMFRSGLLPLRCLREIEQIWLEVKDAIRSVDRHVWLQLSSVLWYWIYPESAAKTTNLPEEVAEMMRRFASKVLRGFAPLVRDSPGLSAGLNRLADHMKMGSLVPDDPIFDLLFPRDYRALDSLAQSLRELALVWAERPASEVAQKLVFYLREGEKISEGWSPQIRRLCRALAEVVSEPDAWLDAFIQDDPGGRLFGPFLEQTMRRRRPNWETRVETCLGIEALADEAASLVLQLAEPPQRLFDRAVCIAAENPGLLESLCLRKEVSLASLKEILRLPKREAAFAAAIGEWAADPEGEVRPEVWLDWRAAILRSGIEDLESVARSSSFEFWLGNILRRDRELAFDWLRCRLEDPDQSSHFLGDSPLAQAVAALSVEQRSTLIREISETSSLVPAVLPWMIGADVSLYQELLKRDDLREHRLAPLERSPDEEWECLAIAALEAGHAPEEIAKQAVWYLGLQGISGSGLDHWQQCDQLFSRLEERVRPDLREVGRYGRKWCQEEIVKAEEREKQWALHGLVGH